MTELALAAGNTSFSKQLPGLQLAVDSTSLGEFKTCPRKYYYSIVEGWSRRETSVHLEFGIWLHGARERYDHSRFAGANHEDALRHVVHWLMKETWNSVLGRPWISDHASKNRLTLVRSAIWYLDKYGEADPLETLMLANGKPAVELSFTFMSGFAAVTGEPVAFCGHLDRFVHFNGEPWVSDIKTTVNALDSRFFNQFNPDNQFSMYTLAGRMIYELPIKGIIVDGCQILVGGTRFGRAPVERTEDQVAEWLEGSYFWLRQMGEAAEAQHWPMNDKSCFTRYGECQFRPVCARPPGARQKWLELDYKKRIWDPLLRRGDV